MALNTDNIGSRPVPDPTELTARAVDEAKAELKEYADSQLAIRDERLSGIDKATSLRMDAIQAFPELVDKEVQHAKELSEAKLEAERQLAAATTAHLREITDVRFLAAERLASRESELNALALAAAFAAQKEAAAKQDESNRLATSKSDAATAEALAKLGQLFDTSIKSVGDKVDDLKDRTGRIESVKVGGDQSRVGLYTGMAAIGGVVGLVIAVIGFLATK